MEVGKIQQNYLLAKPANGGVQTAQSFTGAVGMSEIEYIKKLCGNPKMAKFALENKWLERLQGELGGIVVTGVGTGLVAPFPIAFNPFVKAKPDATEEEKAEVRRTKQYSAWRQPISAVIAMLFQAGAQPYIDKFLDSLTNDPASAKKWWVFLDQSAINKASYLERHIKAEMEKEVSNNTLNKRELAYKHLKLKPAVEKEVYSEIENGTLKLKGSDEIDKEIKKRVNALFDKEKTEGTLDAKLKDISKKDIKKAFKIEIGERVKAKQKTQISDMAKILREEGAIKIGERVIDSKTMADLFNKKIDAYIAEAEKLKVHRHSKGEFKGRDFYLTRAEDLIDNEAELRRILDPAKLPPLEKNPSKADIAKLENYLKEEIKKADKDAVKEILQEILDKDDPVVRRSRCTRTLERIDCIKDLCGGKEFSLSEYSQAIKNQNAIIDDKINELKSLKLDPKKSSPEQLKEAMIKLIEKCQYDGRKPLLKKLLGEDGKVFGTVKKTLETRVYEDMVNAYQALVKTRFTGVSQALKVLVGVCVTLPISCTALNWVYPRFMEIFFPGLAGIKKESQEGGTK